MTTGMMANIVGCVPVTKDSWMYSDSKGDAAADVLTSLANQLTNKFIHTHSIQLKQASAEGREDMLSAIEDLFQLGDDDQSLDT